MAGWCILYKNSREVWRLKFDGRGILVIHHEYYIMKYDNGVCGFQPGWLSSKVSAKFLAAVLKTVAGQPV